MEIDLCVRSKAAPCAVLASIPPDLIGIPKLKELPFKKTYTLSQDSFVELSVDKLENGHYELQINTPSRNERMTDPKLKKIVEMAQMYIWRELSTSLRHSSLSPCPSMSHSGADEVLALYQCLAAVKLEREKPYSMTVSGPRGLYELFALQPKGSISELSIETNYVYGNSMKWKVEVESNHQIVERADRIISDLLGEWLRPGGGSLRRDLDKDMGLIRYHHANYVPARTISLAENL